MLNLANDSNKTTTWPKSRQRVIETFLLWWQIRPGDILSRIGILQVSHIMTLERWGRKIMRYSNGKRVQNAWYICFRLSKIIGKLILT